MRKIAKIILLLFFVLATLMPFSDINYKPAQAATGNLIYVDAASPGVPDGLSWNTAWHTIQDAVDDARFSGSGNTILVAAGIYNEEVTLNAANAGAAGAPNVIQAKPGDRPIVDATGTLNGVGFIFGWNAGGANYITVDGFEVINGSWYGNIFAYKSSNITIQNSIVHHNTYGGSGIYVSRCDYFQSISNTVYDIPAVAPGNAGYGIYIQNSMYGIARGNTVHDVGGSGIEFECSNTTVPNDYGLVENNLVYNADIAFNNNNVSHTTIQNNVARDSVGGIILNTFWNFPARLTQYNIVANNTVSGITGQASSGYAAIILLGSYGGDLSVAYNTINNNLVYNSSYGLHAEAMNDGSAKLASNSFINNTLYNNLYGYSAKDYGGNNILKNNIIINGTSGIEVDATSTLAGESYNDVYNNVTNYSGLTAGATDYSFNPLFVDAANHDFHLQSRGGSYHSGSWLADATDSPGIDAGDPADNYSNEPYYNGNRINLGFEGNTVQASKTYVASAIASATPLPTTGTDYNWNKFSGLLILSLLSFAAWRAYVYKKKDIYVI